MPHAHDADVVVPEQGLRAHLRAHRAPHDAGFQIYGAVTQWRAVLVRLLYKTQPHAGSFVANAGNERSP